MHYLWRRSYNYRDKTTNRVEYNELLNWRRWTVKALLRGHHGDFTNEKVLKHWYLPETLPDVRPCEALKNIKPVANMGRWTNK